MKTNRGQRLGRAVAVAAIAVVGVAGCGTANATAGRAKEAGNASYMAVVAKKAAPAQAKSARTSVRFATYNVRTSALNNSMLGDNNAKFDKKDRARMQRVAKFITDYQLTVVAIQEPTPKQRNAIMAALPKTFSASRLKGRSDTVVIWNNQVWKYLRNGWVNIPVKYDGNIQRPEIWVKLWNRRTHRKIVVSSFHLASSRGREKLRVEGAQRAVRALRKAANGVPFVLAGDMNGNDRDPSRIGAYRVYKRAGLTYTRTAAKHKYHNNCDSVNSTRGKRLLGPAECGKRGSHGSHLDMVWTKRVRTVGSYRLVISKWATRTSDHFPLITQLYL